MPPSSTGVYTIVDKGSASCRFMRVTVNQIPAHQHTLDTSHIPFACIIQPYAEQPPTEEPIPRVDLTASAGGRVGGGADDGPVRCPRCKGYINPFMSWARGGQQCVCNLCEHTFELPEYYIDAIESYNTLSTSLPVPPSSRTQLVCNAATTPAAPSSRATTSCVGGMDGTGDRAEFWRGSVDFVAPSSFSDKVPQPPAFCFVIDTSQPAVTSNMTQSVMQALRQCLEQFPSVDTDICLLTVDETVHFYSVDTFTETKQQEVLVMADVDEPFTPAPVDTLCLNVQEHRQRLEQVLDSVSKCVASNGLGGFTHPNRAAGNAALQAAVELLESRGGGVVVLFLASVPSAGVGSCYPKGSKGGDKGAKWIAQQMSFYDRLLRSAPCVSVDSFLFDECACEPLLSYPATASGGHVHLMRQFSWTRDYEKLYFDLLRLIRRPSAFDCTFKLRCSKGLGIQDAITPFTVAGGSTAYRVMDKTTFKIPRIDCDTSFAFTIKYQDHLENRRQVFFQVALLHTTLGGDRLIRVHTLAVPVTTSLSSTFRYSEVECVVSYMSRLAAKNIISSGKLWESGGKSSSTSGSISGGGGAGSSAWRDELMQMSVNILYAYRVHCATTSSPGQLILPDSLKHLPVYLTALFKNIAFRESMSSDSSSAERLHSLTELVSCPVNVSVVSLYPRLFPIHRSYTTQKQERKWANKVGERTEVDDNYYLPESIGTSGERVTTDTVCVLDDSHALYLYIGAHVNQEYLQEAFGGSSPEDCVSVREDTAAGSVINKVISQIRKDKGSHPFVPLRIVTARSASEGRFLSLLVEDRVGPEPCYVDFLCLLHRMVHNQIEDS